MKHWLMTAKTIKQAVDRELRDKARHKRIIDAIAKATEMPKFKFCPKHSKF